MFGNGRFHDNFGELLFISSFKNMAEAGDMQEMERMQDEMDMYAPTLQKINTYRKTELQMMTLVRILIIKLEPYATYAEKGTISKTVLGLTFQEFHEIQMADIAEKVEAPGGPALLEIIGKAYLEVRPLCNGRPDRFLESQAISR